MTPEELIITFVDDKLNGNIDLLVTFPLSSLQYDKTFGCPNRKYDCDDTEFMRAIYCLVFNEVWENLSMENSGDGKLRGDTINSSATFFSYPWDNKFIPKWNPPIELIEKIDKFQETFHTIGNMAILPDRRIGEWSIIKPEPEYYNYWCSQVHGLSIEDTEDAPVFPKVWKQVEPLIDGLPLVAHNKAFDESCLKAVFRVYQMDYPYYEFHCTCIASRKVWPEGHHNLDIIAARCGYNLENHHHALADAEACAAIALKIL